MELNAVNIFCVTFGISTLVYSLFKATHERKYWRVQYGYYIHVTFDIMLYFITGVFIITYNLICILRDYLTDDYQNIVQRQKFKSASARYSKN